MKAGSVSAAARVVIPRGNSITLDAAQAAPKSAVKPFTFLQVSDSHIGFNKAANASPESWWTSSMMKIL